MLAIPDRITALPWNNILGTLWEQGYSRIGNLLTEPECKSIQSLYSDPGKFRTRIDMARYRFGKGEYQYFQHPLPEMVTELLQTFYRCLQATANAWMAALKINVSYPEEHDGFLDLCRASGQTRPTPLLLRYRTGDFNCLHQDVYGEVVFPFQVIIALSCPMKEFAGGELLLVEQRPRAQSRGHVLNLTQGEAVVISTRFRPVKGTHGFYRASIRHGVSTITSGERFTLGIVFHDSK